MATTLSVSNETESSMSRLTKDGRHLTYEGMETRIFIEGYPLLTGRQLKSFNNPNAPEPAVQERSVCVTRLLTLHRAILTLF